MALKNIILSVIGFSAGAFVAAGIFAFLAVIGIFPRLIGKTKTKQNILLFENMLILGGMAGNILYFYHPSMPIRSQLLLAVIGLSSGIFIGCLVMSLSETLKAFPVMCRRIHLAVGIQYIVISLGFGKMLGSLFYFFKGLSQGLQ